MEQWSNGVMKGLIEVGILTLVFPNTPTLQHSSTPVIQKRVRLASLSTLLFGWFISLEGWMLSQLGPCLLAAKTR
jgi:hypothetical protein